MGKTVFDLNNIEIKSNFVFFFSFLAFQKVEEYISPCRRLEQLYWKTNFRVTGLATSYLLSNIKMWNFQLVFYNNLAQHGKYEVKHKYMSLRNTSQ